MPMPEPDPSACLRAAELHAANNSYRAMAEILRSEGWPCGSHQTASNWAARGRQMAAFSSQLDRDDGRLRLAEILDEEIQQLRKMRDEGVADWESIMPHLKWLVREFARLKGTDAPTLSQVSVRDLRTEDPRPDDGVLSDADRAIARVQERERVNRVRRLEERQRQDREGA